MPITIFYANQVYDEYIQLPERVRIELPDGCYIYFLKDSRNRHWYRKDITPVLLADVPKELLTLLLLMQ